MILAAQYCSFNCQIWFNRELFTTINDVVWVYDYKCLQLPKYCMFYYPHLKISDGKLVFDATTTQTLDLGKLTICTCAIVKKSLSFF